MSSSPTRTIGAGGPAEPGLGGNPLGTDGTAFFLTFVGAESAQQYMLHGAVLAPFGFGEPVAPAGQPDRGAERPPGVTSPPGAPEWDRDDGFFEGFHCTDNDLSVMLPVVGRRRG